MSDQVVVDEADLLDVYSATLSDRGKTKMRRIIHNADEVDETDPEQARAEGFAAGLFMAGMVSMGAFEEDTVMSVDEAQDYLNEQAGDDFYGVIKPSEYDGDLYVRTKHPNANTAVKSFDVPDGWESNVVSHGHGITFSRTAEDNGYGVTD